MKASTMELPYEIANSSREVQEHYARMIADGQTPRFAEMAALQQAPGTRGTDRTLMEGRCDGSWLDKLPKRQAQWMLREARSAGISTVGKYYMSGLADSRGHKDPSAWIDSVEDIRRVAKARNLSVQGIVSVEGVPEPPKRVPLNKKLVNEMARSMMAKDASLTKKEAVRAVREKHTPHWHKTA
jgi:hypothetical protein